MSPLAYARELPRHEKARRFDIRRRSRTSGVEMDIIKALEKLKDLASSDLDDGIKYAVAAAMLDELQRDNTHRGKTIDPYAAEKIHQAKTGFMGICGLSEEDRSEQWWQTYLDDALYKLDLVARGSTYFHRVSDR